MSSPAEESSSTLDALAAEAERALRSRPSFSIRARLGTGFVLWLLLSVGITSYSILTIERIRDKLVFLEAVGSYTFEIQQARRFEKNYFLYGTNRDDALEHVRNAREILTREHDNMMNVVGEQELAAMTEHLGRYGELLQGLRGKGRGVEDGTVETELRTHGGEMVSGAERLAAKERQAVNQMLAVSARVPLVFLFVLLLSLIYFALLIARQVLAPVHRMLQASRRIADGDLTPIMPAKPYRDEFSDLAMAMNHMMLQLVRRHDMLVQAHKLKAVGTLTAGVAHELNNPINNIMLTADALREDYQRLSEEERLDMVSDLVNESERAQKIVRNLLDFARESEIEAAPHPVQSIIEDTLRLATNQIKLAKVKVKGDLAPNLPPVFGDRRQLEQVFLNIVLNALDAMPKGGTLTITCDNVRNGDMVSVAFTDSGVGIPEHRMADIFSPFFTTKPGAKGTGLGLSVSLGIIRQHGGDITVKSQVGKGTTFVVTLPVAKVPAEMPGDEDEEDLVR
jgi:two-component system, NtrC family, sensor kinase